MNANTGTGNGLTQRELSVLLDDRLRQVREWILGCYGGMPQNQALAVQAILDLIDLLPTDDPLMFPQLQQLQYLREQIGISAEDVRDGDTIVDDGFPLVRKGTAMLPRTVAHFCQWDIGKNEWDLRDVTIAYETTYPQMIQHNHIALVQNDQAMVVIDAERVYRSIVSGKEELHVVGTCVQVDPNMQYFTYQGKDCSMYLRQLFTVGEDYKLIIRDTEHHGANIVFAFHE